ncbi:MAG TPA: hypothetical protein VIJ85_13045 [Rhizomicrobium sp.]
MPVTTVLNGEGSATIVEAQNDNGGMFAHRFSWSAAFAGAFVATAVTFFLLALGTGFGLSLVSVQTTSAPTFLTLGAIYFLAAQAFGFAVGGHLAGRLIGPAPETAREEEFRSAAHGLVVWALTVVATATLVAIGGMVAGNSAMSVVTNSGKPTAAGALTPPVVGYWADLLFRPALAPSQASLAWREYAQADTGTANDATPPPAPAPAQQFTPSTDFPETTPPAPSSPQHALTNSGPPATEPSGAMNSGPATTAPSSTSAPTTMSSGPRDQEIPPSAPAGFTPPASVGADKAETSRIIEVGMANGMRLNQYDKDRIAGLIAQDTGLSAPEAQRRVDNAETRIYNDEVKTADAARKVASYASLWIAFSLLFGAVVAAMAAMSARWQDDRTTFGWPRRDPA